MTSIFQRKGCRCTPSSVTLADVFTDTITNVKVLTPGGEWREARSLTWGMHGDLIGVSVDFDGTAVETYIDYRPREVRDGAFVSQRPGIELIPYDGLCVVQWFWRRFACKVCGTCTCGEGEPGHVHP